MLRIRFCLALVVAAGLLVPASALAHRAATNSERAAILAAAVHQGEVSSTQAACQAVTISTVNQAYAVLSWPAKLSRACAAVAANGVIVEQKRPSSWLLVAAGSSLQCPVKTVPTNVARDLGVCR
jgi:hypothetical protein